MSRRARSAEELVAFAPDVLLAAGDAAAAGLRQATRTLPIVFANVADPEGAGLVENLPHPGGNVTRRSFELSSEMLPDPLRLPLSRQSHHCSVSR
jgi:putative ABC transport system substrate-binding protein